MNTGTHNDEAPDAKPRRTGGTVGRGYSLSPDSVRRNALEQAIRFGPNNHSPEHVVAAAAAFEAYVMFGSPAPIPGPLLPPDLVEQATKVPADTLYAVQLILAERRRQIQKGYLKHTDDEHTDGRIAFEAAAAIMPVGSQLLHPIKPGGEMEAADGWIEIHEDRPRADVLVEGIALALAELERVHRSDKAENDRRVMVETPGALEELARRNPDYVPADPRKDTMADTWQPAKQHHAPLGAELAGKSVDTVYTDGLDDQPGTEPETPVATFGDLEKMHHAIGRPRDPMKETYRNRYCVPGHSSDAARFRLLSVYWEEAPTEHPETRGQRFFHITQAGREALAKAIAAGAPVFRFEIENGE